jgi:carotenoid cleavage dioxygenase
MNSVAMNSIVETKIRDAITQSLIKVGKFNRKWAPNFNGPHPYLTGIHKPMREEVTLEALAVTGRIPEGLDGRYLRIGPNALNPHNPARYHWFTGDGMVHGVRIKDGRALWYRNRWVRTSEVSAALGETRKPGPRFREGMVNTNVIAHAGTYFALVEAGSTPVALDGELETVAHDDFGGTLKHTFSAHPHKDPVSGELHAITYDALDEKHVWHVVVGADGRVRREEPVAVAHGPSIHDCAITARFVVVLDLPVTFSMRAMLAGYEFPFRWNKKHGARVGLLGREGAGRDIIWCEVNPCYVYHPCNAYDDADGTVVLDVVVHDRNGERDFRGPDARVIALERWRIDPVTRRVAREVIDDQAQEFPRYDERLTGRDYRYAYSVAAAAGTEDLVGGHAIIKHDLRARTREIRDFGDGRFPGEFVFIPAAEGAGEDEGWLMGLVVDMRTETTELVILNARDFTGEAVARIHLPHRVPPGFHGNWVAV